MEEAEDGFIELEASPSPGIVAIQKIREECHVCNECLSILLPKTSPVSDANDDPPNDTPTCIVCTGILGSTLQSNVLTQLKDKFKPYGGLTSKTNVLHSDSPTVSLPSMLLLRAFIVSRVLQKLSTSEEVVVADALTYYNRVKDLLKSRIDNDVNEHYEECSDSDEEECEETMSPIYEEEGSMCYHVLYHAPTDATHTIPTILQNCLYSSKSNQRNPKAQFRQRFRGNDPTLKQGGCPRANLEANTLGIFEYSDVEKVPVSVADMTAAIDSPQLSSRSEAHEDLYQWLLHTKDHPAACVAVCAWRTHYYLGGNYTKSSREVSQTPFYVPNDSKVAGERNRMVRKGRSSVMEEINQHLGPAVGGISTANNKRTSNDTTGSGSVVYGLCKFHASGREDLDVLMKSIPSPDHGRPFVCEVIDSYRLPTQSDLDHAACGINSLKADDEIWSRETGFYGRNVEGGVGVNELVYRPKASFGNLQADTEHKVKHYGCRCYSSQPLTPATLDQRLLRTSPLLIHQSTPVRVLHRRSNIVRKRYVLHVTPTFIDEHWFTLRLSTSAGTYVKEFVHGDLGRTVPSVQSLLTLALTDGTGLNLNGVKTDIVQLDCEGIDCGVFVEPDLNDITNEASPEPVAKETNELDEQDTLSTVSKKQKIDT